MTVIGQSREDDLIRGYLSDWVPDTGDDVAALTISQGEELLVSTDALIEGVHFIRAAPADLVGEKALRVNLSDIVASGGWPRWSVLTLSLPSDLPETWLADFARGYRRACDDTGTRLMGGDLTSAPKDIAISVTAMGTVTTGQRLTRAGATPGDLIVVSGVLGEASLGLAAILGNGDARWLRRHFCPPYRRDLSRALVADGLVSAMMDLSDGLATDLPRLCDASRVGCSVALENLPISTAARETGLAPIDAFSAGEDFELLMTVPEVSLSPLEARAARQGVRVSVIGSVTEDHSRELTRFGTPIEWPSGWRHFT